MNGPGTSKRILCFLAAAGMYALPVHPGTGAQEPPAPAPAAPKAAESVQSFLDEVYKLYELPFREGLHSLEAEFRIRTTGDRALERFKDGIVIEYRWERSGREEIEPRGAPGTLRKVLRGMLQGTWRDLAAGGVFAWPENLEPTLDREGGQAVLLLSAEGKPRGRIVFDPDTKLVLRAELDRRGTVIPGYILAGGKLRLTTRAAGGGKDGGRTRGRRTYGGFRKVNGHFLATTITLGEGRGATTFQAAYTSINGKRAVVEKADEAEVRALVNSFTRGYGKMSVEDKLLALKRLEETGHEKAAEAAARYALKDRDPSVRAAAARTLGAMGCRNVVPTLGRAMKSNVKEAEVYLAVVKALGEIGDPKAVPYLAEDIWSTAKKVSGTDLASARIEALGNIRSRKSVEALIKLMSAGKPWQMGGGVQSALRASLRKLTGQNFGRRDDRFRHERDRWMQWWNDHKNRFKLEEDR